MKDERNASSALMSWVFGLTGGIASGKSTVGKRFAARRVPVLDADQIAREVVAPGTEGLAAVIEAFGPGVLQPDGALDRKALAALVFADDARRRTLNAITHPRIAVATQLAIGQLAARGEPLVCYEAALIVENRLADAFRPLVVVVASVEAQIRRAMARDEADESQVRARVQAQLGAEEREKVADLVIRNEGSLDALLALADETLDAILARTQAPADRYPRP
jgi:dephospho-CoA kinase